MKRKKLIRRADEKAVALGKDPNMLEGKGILKVRLFSLQVFITTAKPLQFWVITNIYVKTDFFGYGQIMSLAQNQLI